MKKFVRTASSAAVLVLIPGVLMASEGLALAQISDSKTAPAADPTAPAPEGTPPADVDTSAAEAPASPASTDPAPDAEGAPAQESASGSATAGSAAVGTTSSAAADKDSDAPRSQEMPVLLGESKELKGEREEQTASEPEVAPNDLPFTYHQKHIDLAGGVALAGANNAGLDPYRENPVLAEGFVRAGGTVMTSGLWAVSLLGGLGGGSYSLNVRDQESHLSVFHFNVAAEARYHFHHRFYAYGRLALGPELASTRIGSDESALRLTEKNWAFRGEGTAGVAMRVLGPSDGSERNLRVWLFLEGGYRLSSSHSQNLRTDEEDGPARPVELELASLSTSGGVGNAGVMFSF